MDSESFPPIRVPVPPISIPPLLVDWIPGQLRWAIHRCRDHSLLIPINRPSCCRIDPSPKTKRRVSSFSRRSQMSLTARTTCHSLDMLRLWGTTPSWMLQHSPRLVRSPLPISALMQWPSRSTRCSASPPVSAHWSSKCPSSHSSSVHGLLEAPSMSSKSLDRS